MERLHKPLTVLDQQLGALVDLKATLAGKLSPMDQDVAVSALDHVAGLVLNGGGAEALHALVRDALGAPRART